MRFKRLIFALATMVVISGIFFFTKTQTTVIQNKSKVLSDAPIEHGIKGAIAFYNRIRMNPVTGTIDIKDVRMARKGVENLSQSKALNLNWEEMGPSNVGGRTRAILFDKDNPNIIYAGGVSGGLWKSTTNGQSWTKIPLSESVVVSCIAQSPVDGTIYVGTGEGLANYTGTNFNSGQYGAGLFKSTDGTNFTLISNTTSWSLINRVAVDKNGKVFVAASSGLKTSKSDGSWKNSKNGTCKDVKITKNGETAVFAINGTIYIGSTTTENWTKQSALPAGKRAEIGVSPSDDNVIYVVIAASNGSLAGIYKTSDKGANWSQIAPGGSPSFNLFGDNNQGWYDIAIIVSKTNPDLVFVGGIELWKGQKITNNAPYSWTRISSQGEFLSNGQPNPHYIHADIHALVQNPSNNNGFFIGCDGGIFETSNNGVSFTSKNINYAITQYYAVACSPNGWAMGGTQDNSTPYVDGKGNNKKEARVLYGGDGGWSAFSSLDQKMLFATSQHGHAGRSNDNGNTWERPTQKDKKTAAFFSDALLSDNVHKTSAFVTPLLLWETRNFPNSIDSIFYIADTTYAVGDTFYARSLENGNYPFPVIATKALNTGDTVKVQDPIESRYFIGAKNGVYMTDQPLYYTGKPPRWYKIANVSGTVWTFSISKDGDIFYYAVNNKLYRLSNLLTSQDSSTLQFDENGYALQNTLIKSFADIITSIAIDPADANRIIVTLGGFSGSYAHVYYSQNATAASPTFVSKKGDLPSTLPVYAALIPMQNPNTVILGTEYGIMATENISSASPTWTKQNTGIDDPVPVFMLRQQIYQQPWMLTGRWDKGVFVSMVYPGIYNYGEIYAATHGRGLFKCKNYVGFRDIDKGTGKVFKSEIKLYPNPVNTTATIEFETAARNSVNAGIYDVNGRFVKNINFGTLPAGNQKLRIDVSDLNTGVYIIRIISGNQSKTSKFIVK